MKQGESGQSGLASMVGIVVLIAAGAGALTSVSYVVPKVSDSTDVQAIVALVLRLAGFGLLLGAGYLLARRRRQP